MKEFKLKENEIKELTTVKGGCIALLLMDKKSVIC